jgi:hypothetical protein
MILRRKSTFDVDIPPLVLPSEEGRETAQKVRNAIKYVPGFADEIRGMLAESTESTKERGKGGRTRSAMRDDAVLEIAWHVFTNSKWTKLKDRSKRGNNTFAGKLRERFPDIAEPQLVALIQKARRRFKK